MSAATFKVELKSPARKDGTYAVRIRITKFRQHAYWNLGKYVLKSQFNKTPSLRLHNYIIDHENAKQLNNAIKNALTGLDQVADALPGATAAGIKEAYAKAINPEPEEKQEYRNFFAFAEEFIQRRREQTFSTGELFHYLLKDFKKIVGEHTPLEEMFSARMVHKYIQALKAKGNGPVTINNKLKDLNTIFLAGVSEKALPPIDSPFPDAKVNAPKSKLQRPTAEQIRQFINYQPENHLQEMAQKTAMLQYLLQGARISEALTLKWENLHAKVAEYLPLKGAKKPKFVPRSEMLNKLISVIPKDGVFVLPYLGKDYFELNPRNQYNRRKRQRELVNKGLKEIAEKLGFSFKLKSHMFRHAFADAIIATGSSVHVAAALLGHTNPRTTEGYIKDLQMEDVSDVSLSIFDSLKGEQEGEQ